MNRSSCALRTDLDRSHFKPSQYERGLRLFLRSRFGSSESRPRMHNSANIPATSHTHRKVNRKHFHVIAIYETIFYSCLALIALMKASNTSPLNPLKTKSCQTSYSLTVRESFFFLFHFFFPFIYLLIPCFFLALVPTYLLCLNII